MTRKLYILGSGFTKAFCSTSPMMCDVITKLSQRGLAKEIDELKSWGIVADEKILTLLADNLYNPSVEDELKQSRARIDILQTIVDCFGDIVPDDQDQFEAKILDRFSCNEDRFVDVASFNYDTLIEDHSTNWEYMPKVSSSPYLGQPNVFNISAIKRRVGLVKLHGSVNWYSNSPNAQTLAETFCVGKTDPNLSSLRRLSTPVVVPFSYVRGRYTDGSLYSAIWKKFEIALLEADEIEIVGYGFPETDMYVLPMIMKHQGKITRIINFSRPKTLPASLESKLLLGDAKDLF